MAEADERAAGELLEGRYRLVERLGRGGFGDVWRADELLPDGSALRQVALKLLHASAASARDWSAEARIIAALRHPALVTIYAAGVLGLERQVPFVAMELLEGDSLRAFVVERRRVAWRRVLSWARQIAAALDVIHQAGVIHLDLKPANLFLPEQGGIKVLDFGIARQGREQAAAVAPAAADGELATAAFVVAQRERQAAEPDATLGRTSRSVVGTPGFMAPEIFEDAEASPAADAYALAACVVQLATGRLPQAVADQPEPERTYSAQQAWYAELRAATVRGQVRDLHADHPELPAALRALLLRWLALDPQARGVAPGTMRAQLEQVWRCPAGWSGNPYRGLDPYGLADEGKLCGRDGDVERLATGLRGQPCLVLQGEGGTGLTSLALAGVVPALARAFADGRDDWHCCVLAVGDDPDSAIERGLGDWLSQRGAEDDGGDLIEALCAHAAGSREGLVVLLDDLRGVLTAAPERCRRLTELVTRLAAAPPGLRLLCTVREDLTAELLALPLGEALRPWLRFITAPAVGAVAELARGPAGAQGIESAEIDTIAVEVQNELQLDGRRLPYVSLALERWWRQLHTGDGGGAPWRGGGGVLGALAEHAERTLNELGHDECAEAERVLLRMVSADGDAVEVAEATLQGVALDSALRRRVMGRLCEARLLMRVGDRLRLGHPGLVDAWKRLHELRLHDLARLTFLEELRQAARRWAMAGGGSSGVWRGARLRRLLQRRAEIEAEIGGEERSFIAASRRSERLGWLLRTLVAMAVVAGAAGVLWWQQRLEARALEHQRSLQLARRRAAIEHMVTRSRRSDDPYLRVALLAGAMKLGSDDPALPLELLQAQTGLPRARFLTAEEVATPMFPWGDRWLIGGGGRHATIFDFRPPGGAEWGPVGFRFVPHAGGLYDIAPIGFDTSFVTRGLDGQLKVWRLREIGKLALAAVSPMRCSRGLSTVLVAARAPVITCTTEQGIARWDLRHPAEVGRDGFRGRVLDLSADGEWVAAARLDELLLWRPADGRRHQLGLDHAPSLARFSPRDAVVALVRPYAAELWSLGDGEPMHLITADTLIHDPVDARFSDDGLDLAVCSFEGDGQWSYLRRGGRAESDPPPPASNRPCRRHAERWPRRLDRVRDYPAPFGRVQLGPRVYPGGWRMRDGRVITHDLVLFDLKDRWREGLTTLRAPPREPPQLGASVAAVQRDGDQVLWQVGGRVRLHARQGVELLRRKGHLLAACSDDRHLAWRRASDASWEVFAVRHDEIIATIAREPGFVLGIDPGCNRLFVQRGDGQLTAVLLATTGDRHKLRHLEALRVSGGAYAAEGYVYDARPSARIGVGDAGAPGLWLAMSGGSMLRVSGADGSVQPYGGATPSADFMVDGPSPGDLLFGDETGVVLRRQGERDRVLLPFRRARRWEDALVRPAATTALLAWAHGVAVLDLRRRQLVAELPTPGRGRLAPWDDGGSALSWAFDFMGQPAGEVIPVAPKLAAEIGAATSNQRARLGPDGRPRIELSD